MKYILPLLVIVFLAFAAQPSEAVEVLHNYYSMKGDTEELAGNYPDIAIYSEHASSTGLGLEIFSVDVALNITELSEEELGALPTMYVDGVHHGNEGMSAEAAFLFLQDVLERSAADPTYLEGKRLVVTPVMNADGYLEDCRNNWNGVDLNRNYPYMWGMYGTSDTRGSCPASGTYRGPSEGSEAETQANMEMMRGMNLYVYFSGHTGSNDIVLPWKITGEFAVPIADWDLYEHFLNESTNVSGLSYRDPSGAGESIAWGYGARNAVSVIVEVDTMQWLPGVTTTIREALANELLMYDLAWENLLLFGGHLEIVSETSDSVKVINTGWGAAYNITAGNGITEKIGPGETKTIKKGSNVLQYLRLVHVGEEADLTQITMELGDVMEDDGEITPALSPLSIIFSLIAVVALRKRK
ncbi:MAG: M14 family zinc carboxypeptidase [Candidatus Poseidoniia archaeon]|nr:M14 family zinc carboxypeptidase [Candidatus Poseidoniia archaeon]MDP6442044.1 M14 family zinc carboxypeptidase [Candidatus Poseidoniia archaeon]HJL71206.1 M14 family zinc carboxypeptidase [Candidatus Poseidoniia archaeon]